MPFQKLGLSEPIVRAVAAERYTTPTPIQLQAIPHVLAGKDLLGCAQTGTGKTAAFALPILHRLSEVAGRANSHGRFSRVLVLSPTRELASQIGQSFATYGRHTRLKHVVIYGGVGQFPQTRALKQGVDIIIATPGRLMDLMNQGFVDLRAVDTFVLDEADRMLDMGFIPDIRKIVSKLPAKRQTLFFSATMPPDIRQLADTLLNDPVTVKVAAKSAAADTVEQSVFLVEQRYKPYLLQHVITNLAATRTLVFTRTKHGADKVAKQLNHAGIRAEALHGDKSQSARQKALASFKSQHPPVLVATDVAARGLDVDDISHVINFDVPNIAETYVHRIGRTGRAGATGIAMTFCCAGERGDLKAIERLIRQSIRIDTNQPAYKLPEPQPGQGGGQRPAGQRPPKQRAGNSSSSGRSGSNNSGGSGSGGHASRRVRVDGNSTAPVGQAKQFRGRAKRPKRRGVLGNC